MKKPWILIVCAVALIGIVTSILVWFRLQTTPTQATKELPEKNGVSVPVEHSASTPEFDLIPQRHGIEAVARAVEQRVENLSEPILGDPLLVDRLGDALASRLTLMMQADVDTWASEASRFTEAPDLEAIDPFFKNTLRERWMAAARGYENIPVASSGISIRSVRVDEEPNFEVGAPGLVIRAAAGLASANYPSPPTDDPLLHAVEVMIPMKIRTQASRQHDQPAMAALRLFWNSRMQEWQPYDLIIYMDFSVNGKTVPFPYL